MTNRIDKKITGKYFLEDGYITDGYSRVCGWKGTIVYNSLRRRVDFESQTCFPSIDLMAKEHHASRDVIMDGLKILEDWGIIKKTKQRRKGGGWKSNLYYLPEKSEWKPIPNSEQYVANSHIRNVDNSDSLNGCQPPDQVADTDTKVTQVEGNTDKGIAEASSAEWSLEEEIKKLENSDRRDLNIIALYWTIKPPLIENSEQAQYQIKRNLRPAKRLTPYSDERLVATMEHLAKNADFKWTLESCEKYIAERQLKTK